MLALADVSISQTELIARVLRGFAQSGSVDESLQDGRGPVGWIQFSGVCLGLGSWGGVQASSSVTAEEGGEELVDTHTHRRVI